VQIARFNRRITMLLCKKMVGAAGFEPTTPTPPV
jgi:hypothetical protein